MLGLLAGGWAVSGVSIFQSGHALDDHDPISVQRLRHRSGNTLELASGYPQIATPGGVEKVLSNYFNKNCFTSLPLTGVDALTTGFGNAGIGIVTGPGQIYTDSALSKKFAVRWPVETTNLEFRAEFFNAFNHAQFADPDTNFSSATFGKIQSTAVSPRVMQFALKLSF